MLLGHMILPHSTTLLRQYRRNIGNWLAREALVGADVAGRQSIGQYSIR